MDKKDINFRFIQAIDTLIERNSQLSKGEIAGILGIKPSKLSEILNSRMSIGVDLAAAICNSYGISASWLLYNHGEMFNSDISTIPDVPISPNETPIQPMTIFKSDEGERIPIYNAEASAGGGALRLDKEYVIGYIMVPFAKKGDIALMTVGNSMEPEISAGDILIVRHRIDWRDCVERGKVYVVVTTEEIFVKVISSVVPEGLILHSFNPRYEDFPVPFKIIHSIFKLIGLISQKSY